MTRKILFGVLTVALFVAGFSLASFPALAELRTSRSRSSAARRS